MAKTIKVKESVNRNGFRRLVYKEGRKEILYVYYPNQYADGYRLHGRGWCYSLYEDIETPKRQAEEFLNNYYSIFGGCEIVYL